MLLHWVSYLNKEIMMSAKLGVWSVSLHTLHKDQKASLKMTREFHLPNGCSVRPSPSTPNQGSVELLFEYPLTTEDPVARPCCRFSCKYWTMSEDHHHHADMTAEFAIHYHHRTKRVRDIYWRNDFARIGETGC